MNLSEGFWEVFRLQLVLAIDWLSALKIRSSDWKLIVTENRRSGSACRYFPSVGF